MGGQRRQMDRCEQVDRGDRWTDVNWWTEGTDGQVEWVDRHEQIDRHEQVDRWDRWDRCE